MYSKTQIKRCFVFLVVYLSCHEITCILGCNRSDINRAVQPPGTATEDGLKLEISNIVLRIGCMILLWHSLGLPYNHLGRNGIVSSCVFVA